MITATEARSRTTETGKDLLTRLKARALSDVDRISDDIEKACFIGQTYVYSPVGSRMDFRSNLAYEIYKNTILMEFQNAGYRCHITSGRLLVMWGS